MGADVIANVKTIVKSFSGDIFLRLFLCKYFEHSVDVLILSDLMRSLRVIITLP